MTASTAPSPAPVSERDRRALDALARRVDAADPAAQNNLGALYFHRGLVDQAIAAFSRALDLDPKLQVAERNLEIAYRRTGHYDRRVAELEERLRVTPADREARWDLARALRALGRFDRAIEQFGMLERERPGDVAVLVQLGLIEKQRSNLEAATAWFERARALDPESSVVHFYIGETLYHRGFTAAALGSLHRAIEVNPENADAHYLLAFVLGDLDRHEEARAAAKRAVQLNPALGRAQTPLSLDRQVGGRRSGPVRLPELGPDLGRADALAHYNLGTAFRQKRYYDEAMREYRLALERGEDARLVQGAMAEVALLQRDYLAALERYEALLARAPHSSKLWNERGVALLQLNRTGEAIESYRRAEQITPGYPPAQCNLAVAEALAGEHEEAINRLRKVMQGRPELEIPRLNLGLLLLKLQRFELALTAYRQILEQVDTSAAAWNGVGLVLMELGRAADARAAFARAVESDPTSAEAHYNLSFALSTVGDYDASLREVTRAQSLDPYYTPQKFLLAMDLEYETPTIAVVPDISAEVTAGPAAARPRLDEGSVERIIHGLDRPRRSSGAAGDPLLLARDYLAKGLFELAVAEVTRAVSRGASQLEGHVLAGEIFTRRGLHADALERFRAARGLEPGRTDARLGEIRALLALGRGAEAGADAETLAREHPDDVDVLVVVARVRLERGDPAAALQSLSAARTRAPHRADLLKLQGDIAVRLNDLDTAREAYEAAAGLDRQFLQVRLELGRVYEARGDEAAAERCYREALDVLPTYHEAGLAMASLYRRHGKARAAVNLLVELLAGDPQDVETLVALGHALLEDGRSEEALQVFRRAVAFDPGSVGARFFSGVVYAKLRRYREATAEWEQVIRLDPSGAFAKEARKHVRTAQDLERIFRNEAA